MRRWSGAAGLVLGAAAIGLTLSQSPIAVARTSTPEATPLGDCHRRTSVCQSGEVIQLTSLRSGCGPTPSLARGSRSSPGPTDARSFAANGGLVGRGGVVTVPVNRLSTARSGVDLCFTLFLNGNESSELTGEATTPARRRAIATERCRGVLRSPATRHGGRLRPRGPVAWAWGTLPAGPGACFSLWPSSARRTRARGVCQAAGETGRCPRTQEASRGKRRSRCGTCACRR
jgi:hypothetical protein